MTEFLPPISHPSRNRFGSVDSAYATPAPSFASTTLGLFPPTTDSLGGTMTANGAEYERAVVVMTDPATSKPVTVVRSWLVGAAPDAPPAATFAYDADGTPYTGSIASLTR